MQSPLRNTPSRSWGVDERSRELGREHVRGLFFQSLKCRIEFVIQLVEITPKSVRLRKRHLTENERKRAARS